jgi:transposase
MFTSLWRRKLVLKLPVNLNAIQKGVAEATGLSERSVSRIINELDSIGSRTSATSSTPHEVRTRKCTKASLDTFNKSVVRRKVNEFHITGRQRPTVKKIHVRLKQTLNYSGSLWTFRKVLHSLGFKRKKTTNNRRILMEHHNIRAQRISYFRCIRKYRNEGRPIVHTDKTFSWTAQHQFGWSDDALHGLLVPVSKGQRVITVHASGEQGSVPNAYIRLKSHKKTEDYHSDTN